MSILKAFRNKMVAYAFGLGMLSAPACNSSQNTEDVARIDLELATGISKLELNDYFAIPITDSNFSIVNNYGSTDNWNKDSIEDRVSLVIYSESKIGISDILAAAGDKKFVLIEFGGIPQEQQQHAVLGTVVKLLF